MSVKGNISSHKYLGIIILDDLQRHSHVREVKTKATNVSHCSSKVKEQAYNSLVRPRVEYAIPAWDPYEKQHIEKRPFNATSFDNHRKSAEANKK